MKTLVRDVRHGLRLLAKSPGFTAAAVLLLALGIGANSAIFSLVNAILVQPLPFPESDRIVRVWHTPPQSSFPGVKTFSVSPANFLDWQAQNHVFEKMGISHFRSLNLTGDARPAECEEWCSTTADGTYRHFQPAQRARRPKSVSSQ